MALVGFLASGIAMGIPLGIVSYLLLEFLMREIFPIEIEILEKRGNAIQTKRDRGRVIKDKKLGTEALKFLKRKEKIEPPSFKHYMVNHKGKLSLKLYSMGEKDYKPLTLNNDPSLDVVDRGVEFWRTTKLMKNAENYSVIDKWSKFAPYVMIGVCATCIMITVIFTMDGMKDITASINAAAGAFKQAAEMASTKVASTPLH